MLNPLRRWVSNEALTLSGRRVYFVSFLFVVMFVLYGFFFYFSQQQLLLDITSTKVETNQNYFDEKAKEEIRRLHIRANSIAVTIAKLSSTQLENSQAFNLLKDGLAPTLEPFMDYPEIVAIEVTDKDNKPYAVMRKINGKKEFLANYSMPPAFREKHKIVVSKPAIANNEVQGTVRIYLDDQSLLAATANIKKELEQSTEAEVKMLQGHFETTLLPQVLVLFLGIAFILFFSRQIARSYTLIDKQRRDLSLSNQQLEDQFIKVSQLNQSMEVESNERKKAEQKYRAIFENASEGIFQVSPSGAIISANQAMAHILGYDTPSQLLQTSINDLRAQVQADPVRCREAHETIVRTGSISHFEFSIYKKDGSNIWISITAQLLRDENGGVLLYEGTLRNISQQKLAEAELKLAASVFHNTMDGVMIMDKDGRIMSVNPAFTTITGYGANEVVGRHHSLTRFDEEKSDFYREIWDIVVRDGRWEGEVYNHRKNGETFLEWLSIGVVAEADGKPERYVGVFNDITELKRKDERIRHLAFHDSLTDLPNRELLLDRLQQSIATAQRKKEHLGIMFIDLDRFKAINDSFGHNIGDKLLKEVANRLTACLRKSDTVARMGGDEFVVVLNDVKTPKTYAQLAEKIITRLSKSLVLDGNAMQVGVSIGIACFPEDGTDAIELMKHADAAMYAAKSSGRGTYRFYQATMTERAIQRLQMEMELRNAVLNNELELFYQPQISLGNNEVRGVEALVRWRHPQRGLVPPGEFIPLAEETGIIGDLSDWVLAEACRQSRAWQTQGLGRIKISVNISAKQFQRGDLVERITTLAEQHRISPSDLEMELTENAIMANLEEASQTFTRLRELGVSVSMDDFGTGYSSLAYLRRLPIDILKIDQSFIRNVNSNEEDAQIVKTILALGQALKLTVIAEGVENMNQANFLKSCGCACVQGYLYCRPQPAAELEAWLKQSKLAAVYPRLVS
jgi:diguanylate cyclase (GGDEF)-like protein/PAS domain S-box-containing protein